MEIPPGPNGRPTLYNSRIKAYGAGGFVLENPESTAGCPRLYRASYIDHNIVTKQGGDQLTYGKAIHEALFTMEEEAISPEEALGKVWPQQLGPDELGRARADLNRYLERGGPLTTLSTLALEKHLVAPLYEDEQFGPIDFAGILDLISLDPNDPTIIHVTDYKTSAMPPVREAVERDTQGKSYCWLVLNAWESLGLPGQPRVVVFHIDAIRWKDIAVQYTRDEIDEWAAWAEAIGRRILRDEAAEPVLNDRCHWCPIKMDCKAYRRLPGRGVTLLERSTVTELDQMVTWRDQAKDTIKKLEAGVKQVEGVLRSRCEAERFVEVGDRVFYLKPWEETRFDIFRLHDAIGDELFYEVADVSMASLERALARRGRKREAKDLIKQYAERVQTSPRLDEQT